MHGQNHLLFLLVVKEQVLQQVGLLDGNGFLTEIRVQSSGFGYKKLNLASDNDVRCIIDSFTILSPGSGYTSVPDMYVNGELGIAEAVIDPENGFVIGARVLNRTNYI